MEEKELLSKIRELSQIKPKKEWVLFTKREILAKEFGPSISLFPRKLTFGCLAVLLIFFSFFVLAKNSLPGDLFFPLKKFSEESRKVFLSEADRPKVQLELVNRRLEELTRIAEENKVKKLAPAIEEYEQTFTEAREIAKKIKEPKEVRKIVPEIAKLEKNLENLKSYGIEISQGESEKLYQPIVESLLSDLKKRTLTEKEKEILAKAEELYQSGDFSLALAKILEIK